MISVNDLKNFLNDGGSATFATITAQLEQELLKTGNPLKGCKVTKLVTYNVRLNCNYQNAVNNQRQREGKEADFEAKQAWHSPLYDCFNGSIAQHKADAKIENDEEKRTYVKMILNSITTHNYFVNGIEATAEQIDIIKQFKPQKKSYVGQDLDNAVQIITVKRENIVEVRAGGKILTA
jgi:hypothetical protein